MVSVVVPFYNEEENVRLLAEQIAFVFERLPQFDYECVFVDDGSTDGTGEAIDELCEADPRVVPIHFPHNRGQSAALLAGMRQAQGEYILTLDGDLQNDPCDFPDFLERLKTYDCVCGYRANRNDGWARKASSVIANKVRNLFLRDGIRDAGCGAKGFRRECIGHFVPFNGAHRFFAVFVRAAGRTIVEVPVTHHPRQHGNSKYGINNRLWRGLYDLVGVAWLRKRLLMFDADKKE